MIAVAATGTDIFDLAACRERGIGRPTSATTRRLSLPEHVFERGAGAVRRNLVAYRADVEAGRWQQTDQFCLLTHRIDAAGSTRASSDWGLGGGGEVWWVSSRHARAGLRSAGPGAAPDVTPASLHDIVATADVITLHVPLTPGTRT